MNWSPSIIVHVDYPAEVALTPAELAARIAPLLPGCDVTAERSPGGADEVYVARSGSDRTDRYAFTGVDFVPPGEEPWGRCTSFAVDRCRLCHRGENEPRLDDGRRWLQVYSGPDQVGWVDPDLDGLAYEVARAIVRAVPSAKADSLGENDDDDEA
jgi:hypothetical protein